MTVLPDTLLSLLGEQTRRLNTFSSLLEQENQALQHADIEAMSRLNPDKLQHAEQLQWLARELRLLLVPLTGDEDVSRQRDWLHQQLSAHHPALLQQWEAAAQACRLQNERNGQMIEQQLRFNQQALHTLLPTPDPLYGIDGRMGDDSANARRDYGKA